MSASPRIAIVGGGPAGASCARTLAAGGLEVVLFESRPSGEKPCGGGIPSAALREFPELGDSSLPRRVVREVVVLSPDGGAARVPLTEGVHVFRRADLDRFLRGRAEAAGAAIRRARVTGAARIPSGQWEVRTEEGIDGPFDFLVGADGVRGIVRRALDLPYEDGELTLALYGYLHGVSRPEIVLKFPGAFGGYLWAFPRTDHLSVGIGAPHRSATAERLEEELQRFVEEQFPEGSLPPGSLKGYLIPACPRPPAGAPSDRWALIGDAGGFVDPLTREGIAHSIRSGAALARRLLKSGEAATPDLPGDLSLAHRYRRGFFGRDFLESTVRLAAASSAIRRILADLLEGRQRYRGLKARLILNALPCGIELCSGVLAGFRRPEDRRRAAS